ncbi:hypothetical protein [Plantactinospora endophytica]|uniref:Uncharacterized protein n=1 Tax=Plantactinospora endophytica TaxID=673535 RepID=A0ABQ4E2Y1_9ACTN|nr:hypothetical protein [Plantactinospora endophytica]GIG89064.1 hypothetical protein Pen02_40000 [Plantactinospora endophytica]
MTGGQFREVDLDLLADYVGGALDGTPDEIEIARLVDQDAAWAEAYADLTAGIDAVRLDLADWAATPVPMPSAVVDRLTSALARATPPGAAHPTPPDSTAPVDSSTRTDNSTTADNDAEELVGASAEPVDSPEADGDSGSAAPDTRPGPSGGAPGGPTRPAGRPRRQLPAVPAQPGTGTAPGPGRPGRRRRWTRRMAGPILVATVVAGFAGFAVSRLVDAGNSGADQPAGTAMSTAEDGSAPQVFGSGPPRAVLEPSAERVLATGTDYTPTSLPDTVSDLAKQAAPPAPPAATTRSSPSARASGTEQDESTPAPEQATPDTATGASPPCCAPMGAAGGLDRLADRSVLAACLDAIAAAHARGPVAVELVDYATFQGSAALVVVFTDPSGARWAWVTGPNCGSPAAGADRVYQSRVG